MKSELRRIETTLDKLAQKSSTIGPFDKEDSQTELGSVDVKLFSGNKHQNKTPSLPKMKDPQFRNYHHGADPELAMNLLKDIEQLIIGWQKDLNLIEGQIQDIYVEGPIVNGWLECDASQVEKGAEAPTQDQKDTSMDSFSNSAFSCQYKTAAYRLCGLDEKGDFWSRPCPLAQVPDVSIAIARYQKIKELLQRKQERENSLTALAENLVIILKKNH